MPFEIEKSTDFAAIAAAWKAVWPVVPLDPEELAKDAQELKPEFRPDYWLATVNGRAVGVAEACRDVGSYHPQRWTVIILVQPDFRGQGIGSALAQSIWERISPTQPISVLTRVEEGDLAGLAFASKKGHIERHRVFESVLNLQTVDQQGLLRFADRPLAAGVEVVPLRQVDSAEFRPKLHALFEELRGDVPRAHPPTTLEFEFFDSQVLGSTYLKPDGTQIVLAEGEPIGLSLCYEGYSDGEMFQGLTAVRRTFRQQGLASTMKARVIQYGIASGYRTLRVDNDTRNAPILAINQKLGFQPLTGFITLERTIESTS